MERRDPAAVVAPPPTVEESIEALRRLAGVSQKDLARMVLTIRGEHDDQTKIQTIATAYAGLALPAWASTQEP